MLKKATPNKKRKRKHSYSALRATPNKKRRAAAPKRRRARKNTATPPLAANRKRVRRAAPKRRAKRNGSYSMARVRSARRKLRKLPTAQRKVVRKRASAAAERKKTRMAANRRHRKNPRVTPNRKRRVRRAHRKNARVFPNRKRRVRRAHRKNARVFPNRRRTHRRNKHTANRRRTHRRNGSSRARGFDLTSFAKEAAVTGLLIAGGFFAHKLLTNLLEENLIRGMLNPAKPADKAKAGYGYYGADDPAATKPAEKKEEKGLKDYSKLVSGFVAAAGGVLLTGALLGKSKPDIAIKLSAGMVASFIQQALLTYLVASESADAVQYLSGLDSGSAARLSAMSGTRDIWRETIQPFYTPIHGYGEYFKNPAMSGYGEYFKNPAMSGYGEYFKNPAMSGYGAVQEAAAGYGDYTPMLTQAAAGYGQITQAAAGYGKLSDANKALILAGGDALYLNRGLVPDPVAASGTEGFGTYGMNPDIYQATAGTQSHHTVLNHLDPSGNLDRELSVAESQAGLGVSIWNTPLNPMDDGEGSAFRDGALGEYLESESGAVSTVPTTSTWVPGESDGALWAGVRSVDANMSTADTPAGIMQTEGGSGIFG